MLDTDLTLGQRIEKARKYRGFTKKYMAEALIKSKNEITRIEKGEEGLLSVDDIFVLSRTLGLMSIWLISGEGEMLRGEPEKPLSLLERIPKRIDENDTEPANLIPGTYVRMRNTDGNANPMTGSTSETETKL